MLSLLVMSALLGAASFGAGLLPLSFALSKEHITRLSNFGMGLLLGTALGVIIPEGIESIADAEPNSELPVNKIALSLLCGFTFMLIIEQVVSPHSHSDFGGHGVSLKDGSGNQVDSLEFDAELGELEREHGVGGTSQSTPGPTPSGSMNVPLEAVKKKALPLTFGLVVHALADGLALGVSSLPTSTESTSEGSSNLSLIVFLALIIHKAPTALALTSSLLAGSLPRPECKKHLAVFSASTPVGAIASYLLFSFLGAGEGGDWTGLALLLSGGTFLYVATVLQPVSNHSSSGEKADMARIGVIVTGMFVPFVISSLLGHGH